MRYVYFKYYSKDNTGKDNSRNNKNNSNWRKTFLFNSSIYIEIRKFFTIIIINFMKCYRIKKFIYIYIYKIK